MRLVRSLEIKDGSPPMITRLLDTLWADHPGMIEAIGEQNITIELAEPTLGGAGTSRLARYVHVSFEQLISRQSTRAEAARFQEFLEDFRALAADYGVPHIEDVVDIYDEDGVPSSSDRQPD